MNGVRAKKRKLSLVTVFALIEIIIIFLFGLLISVNLFVSNRTAKNRTRQIVEDSYVALTENLENDIKNISRAGFSLMKSETVVRLKAYYYDKISGDSYARNTAINRTMEDLVSLTTYYDVIDSCALWIAPDGELSYNTLYTFVSDDYRKQLLDKVIKEHRYSPTYEGNLRNNGEILITLSLSEQDNSVLAVLLDGDHIAKNLALTAFPKVQTKPYAEDDSLLIICSDEDVVPGTVLSEEETDKPILRKGRIVYYTKLMNILPLYVSFDAASADPALSTFTIYFIVACVLLCFVAFALFLMFRHFFSRPYSRLLGAMRQVSDGDFDVRIEDNITSDFQNIYDGFNYMTSSISSYIEENYRQKSMRVESEFKALQAQINPHFLYNCFANIRSLCKMGDIESVERMTGGLSKLFLYITRNAEPIVKLRDEADNMRDYLEIQRIRFNERVDLQIDSPPEAFREMPIPKLCMQPIAENAYKYAFANKEDGGVFRVRYFAEGNNLRIEFDDNGDIGDSQIEELSEKLVSPEETSGLVNVSRRLLHYAGGRGELFVKRSDLGGLKVTIYLCSQRED